MTGQQFWAHSAPVQKEGGANSKAGWQPLAAHLISVAKMARQFATTAHPQDISFHEEATVCGLLHDYGKYTDCFQQRIITGKGRCAHAIHGAQLAILNQDGKLIRPHLLSAAFAIAGHHSGLPDWQGASGSLQHRLKAKEHIEESFLIRDHAIQDCSEIRALLEQWPAALESLSINPCDLDLRTRMLFSCLWPAR